jgi:hypothetical protein
MLLSPPHVLSLVEAAAGSCALAASFVGSLYLFRPSKGAVTLARNHPDVIRQRIKAAGCVSLVAPFVPVCLLAWKGAFESSDVVGLLGSCLWIEDSTLILRNVNETDF